MARCAGGEVRRVSGAGAQVAFAGGAEAPRYWNARSGAFEALPGLVALPRGSRWERGAAAWRLQRELDENPSRDGLRRPLLKASRESGVLTPLGSYIVVENSMQWKMLEVKQRQTVAGDAALDLVESPAPGWPSVLIACVLFGWFFARIRRRKTA